MKNINTVLRIAIISLVFWGKLFAQDTIITVNNNRILAKIMEVGTEQIKYKKAEFIDGPTYIQNKSEIKSIHYSNGTKEDFAVQVPKPAPLAPLDGNADYYGGPVTPKNKIEIYGSKFNYKNHRMSERQLHHMLEDTKDKELIRLVQQSKDAHKLKFVGFGAIPLGLASLIVFSNSYNPNNNKFSQDKLATSGLLLCGAVACPIVSGIFSGKRKHYNHLAVKLYNEKY